MPRLLPIAVFLAAACAETAAPPPEGTGEVRLFHAVSDLGPVSMAADNDLLLQAVPYGRLTGSAEVSAGTHAFQVRAGTAVVASQTLGVSDGAGFTLVLSRSATGLQLAASADTGLRQPDRANLRLISAPEVPRAPADSGANALAGVLDVYVTAPGASLAAESPRMAIDTGYPSYSTFLYYMPGQWTVRFTRAGTKTVVAEAGPISFTAGEAKAVVVRRAANGGWTTSVEAVE